MRPSWFIIGGSPVLARLNLITQRADRGATATFNNFYTLLTVDLLDESFRQLKRDKAPGADGQTVDQYAGAGLA